MSIGAQIKAARLQKGLSVEDVARATNIRAVFIEQIENDAVDQSEAAVFTRGRIRSIAKYLGLNSDEVLAELGGAASAQTKSAYASDSSLNIFDFQKKQALPPRKSYTLPLILTGLILLAVAIWFSRSFLMQAFDTPPLPVITNSIVESPGTDSVTPEPSTLDPSDVIMTIVATEASWVQVTSSSGEIIFEKTLTVGESFTFGDTSELSIRVGNAGGIQFNVNGVDLGLLGNTGEVIDRVFGLGDPTASN
jgi:cytoskeletal protein RodZ